MRYLADSNRRTRFCRPLTKPLIQGTQKLHLFDCGCKGKVFFRITNYSQQLFFFFFSPEQQQDES